MSRPDAQAYLLRARQFVARGVLDRAFEMFIRIIKKFPDMKQGLEPEFRSVLNDLNESLHADNKVKDVFTNFERACAMYPKNIYMLNDIGIYLYKIGYVIEACAHFQKALRLDPSYVSGEKNYNNLKNCLIERWHYRMLNDKVRNEAYRQAIEKDLKRCKDSVLDLGTGTGLLAVYADEYQPVACTGVDASEIMIDIAQSVMYENDIPCVVLVSKMSTLLNYRDIGGKRTLVTTELFDAGLFGEHVLQTVLHAFEYLMSSIGRVIPGKAEFFVAGVKCDSLNQRYQLSTEAKNMLKISDKYVHIKTSDPYDSEDIHFFKDIVYMTEPASLIKVDFNDVEQMRAILHNVEPLNLEFKVKEAGEVNMIVGWFDLHLTEGVSITTNPLAENRANAWQQAVFFDFIPQMVKPEEEFNVSFSSEDGKIAMINNPSKKITRISTEMLRFLNDTEYMNMICSSIDLVIKYLETVDDISRVKVVDLSPFPMFGMKMMQRGICTLVCVAETRADKQFIASIFEKNDVSLSGVQIINGIHMDKFLEEYHIIYNNFLELCGDVNHKNKDFVDLLLSSKLREEGLVLPYQVTMFAQIIRSPWLDITNRLYNENVHGHKISQFINVYQVSQNINIDIARLEYEALTEPKAVLHINEPIRSQVKNLPITKNGDANAILCWYEISILKGDAVTLSTKRNNACIDAMAFLADPKVPMEVGMMGNIIICADDEDDLFKFLLDNDAKVEDSGRDEATNGEPLNDDIDLPDLNAREEFAPAMTVEQIRELRDRLMANAAEFYGNVASDKQFNTHHQG